MKETSNVIDLAIDCYENEEYNKGEYCHKTSFVWGYQEGYEQAEKDLALTWEDIQKMLKLEEEVKSERRYVFRERKYCEEILRRFNEQRKRG